MATYAVGDIQGCFEPLQRLLKQIAFDPSRDELWSAGDIVNRGPQSLETVRYLRSLGKRFRMVLGNHDLHWLAVAYGVRAAKNKDTLAPLLRADDAAELQDWARHQPLAIYEHDCLLVHAGVDPRWTLEQTLSRANQLQAALRALDPAHSLRELFGNSPKRYSEGDDSKAQNRAITNVFTRMRFCREDGTLEFKHKGPPDQRPPGMKPWFEHPLRVQCGRILFGHWAALQGRCPMPNIEALDTGCSWGEQLTALRLDDGQRFSVPAFV